MKEKNRTGTTFGNALAKIITDSPIPKLVKFLSVFYPPFATISTLTDIAGIKSSQNFEEKMNIFSVSVISRLQALENEMVPIEEGLHEAMIMAINGISISPAEEKIHRFAKIISGHIAGQSDWDKTATLLRILRDLEEIHIHILSKASENVNAKGEAYFTIGKQHRIATTMMGDAEDDKALDIMTELPLGMSDEEVYLFSMELVGKGLLHDKDMGTLSTGGQRFTLTKAAFAFLAEVEIRSKNPD